jgi:hypothetical protein
MKKFGLVLALAILLAGGALTAMSAPAYAQPYEYPPPPADRYATPWVGPDTPWVFYNGDWFLNGVLYYFFGPQYGWGPYYAYETTYIVRPGNWYGPMWNTWYVGHPNFWVVFNQQYPYWRGHQHGHHYDQKFYEQHHHGQGGGWQKGFGGHAGGKPHPEGMKKGHAPEGQKKPGKGMTHPEGMKGGHDGKSQKGQKGDHGGSQHKDKGTGGEVGPSHKGKGAGGGASQGGGGGGHGAAGKQQKGGHGEDKH